MPHLHTVVFSSCCVFFEVECPQYNTDALTLVATLMCHDLVFIFV